jgi:hypothetical protein
LHVWQALLENPISIQLVGYSLGGTCRPSSGGITSGHEMKDEEEESKTGAGKKEEMKRDFEVARKVSPSKA